MRKLNSLTLLFIITIFFTACSEKIPFTVQTQKETFVTRGVNQFSFANCGNHTVHKPKVDILFVIDNSTSTFFIPSEMQAALSNTIHLISENFDYHAYITPLLGAPGETASDRRNFPLVVSNMQGLNSSANVVGIDQVNIQNFFANTQGGNQEHGFSRVKQIIDANNSVSNNIFRKQAHTLVIMISNGDDNDFIVDPYGNIVGSNYNARYQELIQFTKKYADANYSPSSPAYTNSLRSLTFRMLSVVAHNSCQPGYIKGQNYINMSRDLYAYSEASDQAGDPTPDSYDICTGSFNSLFTTVANSLPVTIVNHIYDWWPVKNTTTLDFNPNVIEVKKLTANGIINIPESTSNGFEFINQYYASKNIRKYPLPSSDYPAENHSGYFVKLHGSAEVTSPECLVVKIQDPQEFYGYIAVPKKPDLTDTKILINGVEIPQSNSNGWQYLEEKESINLRITSPTDYTPHPNGVYSSGHVFKMNGNAVYTNEDIVEVIYKPAAL